MDQAPETTLQDKKVALEIEKLQAELEVIRKPFRHPQARAALLTAIGALAFAGVQTYRYSQENVLAQIKTERLAMEAEKLEQRRATVEQRRAALAAEAGAIARENETRRRAVSALAAEFQATQERLASARLTKNQLDHEVQQLREAVKRSGVVLSFEFHKATSQAGSATTENTPATPSIWATDASGKAIDSAPIGTAVTLTRPTVAAPATPKK